MSSHCPIDTRPLIAHIVFRFATGGLENGVANLINRLPRERWRHAIVALDVISTDFKARVQRADVQYVALNKGPGSLVRHYPRVAKLLRRLQPAIVHTRNLAALEASVPAWAMRVPVRVHGEHGWDWLDPEGSSTRYACVRRLYTPFVHHYVALSKQIERYLMERVALPADRVTQIYNGVDTHRFRAATGDRKHHRLFPNAASDLWLVGTVGRMQPIKDHITLATAFVRAVRHSSEAARRLRLVVVGDGPSRVEVARVLDEANIGHLVWLAGERDDVPDILRRLDCFVLPSRSEGVCNTVLEAMATGLPIVATAVGGNPELVEDGRSGTIVPPADSVALASAFLRYFDQPTLARQHGSAARQRAERHFTLQSMVDAYDSLYWRLLYGDRMTREQALQRAPQEPA